MDVHASPNGERGSLVGNLFISVDYFEVMLI